jgi:hypothetical protein
LKSAAVVRRLRWHWRICFQDGVLRAFTELLGVLTTCHLASSRASDAKESKEEPVYLLCSNLIKHCHFCCIPFARSKSLRLAHTLWKAVRLHLFVGGGEESKILWTYFIIWTFLDNHKSFFIGSHFIS